MFQLVVSVIAVVVIVMVSIAAIWYGGSVFTHNQPKVDLAKYLNGAGQIETALNLYNSDHGVFPKGTSDQILSQLLGGNYLKEVPPPGDFILETGQIYRPLTDLQQCYDLNAASGLTTEAKVCPACSDASKGNLPACTQ